jgi:predicted AAA+ superfamily ATPase
MLPQRGSVLLNINEKVLFNYEKVFENMIATSLYRFVVSLYDRGWPEVKLYYHRTYDKAEIDCLLYLEGKPILAIEAKLNADRIPANLFRFRERVNQQFPI